jgi:hypothetical protein
MCRWLACSNDPILFEMLSRSAERFFSEPVDRALAGVSDLQGVGGKSTNINRLEGRTPTATAFKATLQ